MNKLNDAFTAKYRQRQQALKVKLAEQRACLASKPPARKAAKPASTGEVDSWLDELPESCVEPKDEKVLSTKELSISKHGFEVRFHGLPRDYGVSQALRHAPCRPRQSVANNVGPVI